MATAARKAKNRATARQRYAETKAWTDGVKEEAGCARCGGHFPAVALDFHHIRGEKKFNVGSRSHRGIATVKTEVAKCEVICANCHRVITEKEGRPWTRRDYSN